MFEVGKFYTSRVNATFIWKIIKINRVTVDVETYQRDGKFQGEKFRIRLSRARSIFIPVQPENRQGKNQ